MGEVQKNLVLKAAASGQPRNGKKSRNFQEIRYHVEDMFKNIPFNRVEWVTSGFLIITALLTLTAVPWYFWTYGWDWFLFAVFLFFYVATGMSITLGYHRLFSHKSFKAIWPVRLFVLFLM